MAGNEDKVFRLLDYVPTLILNLMYVLIGIAVFIDNGWVGALNFSVQIYLTSMAVLLPYRRFFAKNLVLSQGKDRRKYITRTLLMALVGLTVTIILGLVMPAHPDEPPILLGVLIWVAFMMIGLVMITTSTYTHYFYGQKLVAINAEADKVKAELALLKSQINPHFLFNTLNNIYGLVHMNDPRAPQMISMLSKILRYLLYDCGEQRVSLRKEKELIENYLQLQAMKSKSVADRIDFYSDGIADSHTIAPMLLINFVENCFKHSDIETSEEGWVNISLEVAEDQLHFTTRNTMKPVVTKSKRSGIGLSNTQKMLAGEYADKHSLMAGTVQEFYEIDLKLDLS